MSVSCGSFARCSIACLYSVVTAHSLADSSCHTYYTIFPHHTDEAKEKHSIICHIVLSIDHLHTRLVLSRFPMPFT